MGGCTEQEGQYWRGDSAGKAVGSKRRRFNPDDLPDAERLRTAKERTDRLVDHLSALFLMHEANAIVIHSPALAAQVPRSYAAHAFNQFRRSMHLFEIIRLTAIWDKASADRESIPTIISLISKPEIIEMIVSGTLDYHANQAPPENFQSDLDPQTKAAIQQFWKNVTIKRSNQEAEKARTLLNNAISKANSLTDSSDLESMRNFRDNYIAHNLEQSIPNLHKPTNVRQLKHGSVDGILKETVYVADALHQALNGTGFMWDAARAFARSNAEALWKNCQFTIPRQ